MCGIAGVAARDGDRLPPREIVDAMCRAIVHRGPDDQGIHYGATAQIGMRRLSIIDLASGHQPIHNEDKTVWVVFNGEIYNFRELRRDLEGKGHRFYTNTDTECIVHAYEEYGEDCFTRLRGMFGIAIYDTRTDKLVLARDRVGKKPLYYMLRDGLLGFASELKSLLAVPGFDAAVSSAAIHDYFTLGYVPAPLSIFENVRKLPPAHYLVFRRGELSIHRYWQLEFGPKREESEATLREQLLAQLDDAVRVRLVSDVPFGAFLSGGLDSSVVAVLMAQNLTQPVKTFTIGFKEAAYNEMPDARLIAEHIGAEHHELVVEADAVSLLDELVWHFDEPFGDSSSIPTYLVSRLAAQHVKMVLSGDGGDESFAGYTRYRKYRHLRALMRGSLGLAGPAARLAGHAVPGATGARLRRIGERLSQRYPEQYLSGVALSRPEDLRAVFGVGAVSDDIYRDVRAHFLRPDIAPGLDRVLAGDMATYLVDDVLVKVDRMTMANSLEARAPLLDHRLMEFAARLPTGLKLRGENGKYLLKQVARTLLPPAALEKKKQGFGIPLAAWFRRDLRESMSDLLASRSFRERGIFDVASAQSCMAQHVSGARDYSEQLWLLMTYELWARRFLDAGSTSTAIPSIRQASLS